MQASDSKGGNQSMPVDCNCPGKNQKSAKLADFSLLRRGGSNSRPSGYEPDELPLLYFAMWAANVQL